MTRHGCLLRDMRFLLVLAIAVLMGMGVGGGGLLVIYLVLVEQTPQLTAQGINLVFFVACAGASMLIHLRRRRIDRCLLWGILPGCAAALLGARLTEHVPVQTLRLLFGVMLCVCGGAGLISSLFRGGRSKKEERGQNRTDCRKNPRNSLKNS